MARTSTASTNDWSPKPVARILDELNDELASGHAPEFISAPTGFMPLDVVLGGGSRPGELTLVGGMPGVGKTIFTLQWARNLARLGVNVLYVCYEHEEVDLIVRLLALEMGELPGADPEDSEKIRLRIRDAAMAGGMGLEEILTEEPTAHQAYERVRSYAGKLHLLKGSGRYTGIPELEEMIAPHANTRTFLFVDYLQKVALARNVTDEAEKVTIVTEGLKELALTHGISVVANVASDKSALSSPRLRLHDFRGSSALAFEADVALVLNDKYTCVAKVHRDYDPLKAASFKEWIVLSVEKNRGGPPGIDLEFKKDFPHFRFHEIGGTVVETLVDERTEVG